MKTILNEAEHFVTDLLTDKLDQRYLYHNADHTILTYKRAQELLKADYDEKPDELPILLAALFQYTGRSKGHTDYAKSSIKIAKDFLKERQASEDTIKAVENLILNNRKNNPPPGISDKILRDASNFLYAHEEFEAQSELLRKETNALEDEKLSVAEWREKNLQDFQTEHHFYTPYAQENWQEQKDKNLSDLVSSISKGKKTVKKEELKVKLKNQSPERAIQSLYRVTLRNHLKLSDIADTKANILLSVNAIIISLLMANLIPKLDQPQNEYLTYPTLIFVVFSVASMIMSVLATRPKVDNHVFSEEEINNKKVNLLFFGNFHTMELESFKRGMRGLTESKQDIYDALSTDLFFLGKVLNKKYKLLRWTYTIFIVGIICSVIAFAVALKFYGTENLLESVTA